MEPVRNCHSCGIRYRANERVCAEDGSELVDSNDQMLGTMVGNYRVVRMLGEPLSACLERGPLALGDAATIVIEILDALQAAHDAGVVHRDLKPDNLFLSPQGRVKVLDFGVAKLMPHYDASLAKAMTQTGALIGTPGYMSPEQIVGDPVTASTDIYAVGAILYEMVTGQMAFRGSTMFELFNRIVNDPPPRPTDRRPDLAGPYQDFILKALSKSPADRHPTASVMASDLRAILSLLGTRGTELANDAETRHDHRLPKSADATRSMVASQIPTEGLRSVVARRTNARSTARRASRWPLMLALFALLSGGVSAIVLSEDAAKTTAASASEDQEHDGGGLVAGAPLPEQPNAEPGEPPVPPPKETVEAPPGKTVEVAPNGDVITNVGGVTFIETGNRHKDTRIHRAPDYNPKSFEAASYVPKARALAEQIYPDAKLVTFDVPGVATSGRTNLQIGGAEATYNFLSASHSKRTLPIGLEDERPCWVYVEVNKKGVTARIVDWDECKGKRRPNPKCSLKDVWKRAQSRGAPATGAVAEIDYLHDGWFFSIDQLNISMSIADDC